jgi:hypothetical protein
MGNRLDFIVSFSEEPGITLGYMDCRINSQSVPLQPAMPLFINDTPPLGNEVPLPRSHAHWSMVPGVVFHSPMHIFHK